jgi:phage shock protein PspC (stress-responsive transcriptional regulator)
VGAEAGAPRGSPAPPVPPPPPGAARASEADRPALPLRRRPFGFSRSDDDRLIAGVAGGLARRLGVDAVLLRIAFVVLAFAGGTGLFLYLLAWLLVPVDTAPAPTAPRRAASLQQAVALGMIAVGVLLLLRQLGLWFGDELVFPLMLAALGSAIIWARDDDGRLRWSRVAGRLPNSALAAVATGPVSPVRVVIGTIFVGTAIAGFIAANEGFAALRNLGLAIVAALAPEYMTEPLDETDHQVARAFSEYGHHTGGRSVVRARFRCGGYFTTSEGRENFDERYVFVIYFLGFLSRGD